MSRFYQRMRECEEWGIPFNGPSVEDCIDDDTRGDYAYDLEKQIEMAEYLEDR